MHMVSAAKLTVEEAKDRQNLIGWQCRKLAQSSEAPGVAKTLAQKLVDRWVTQEKRRVDKEKKSRGGGGSNAAA